jgi:hypothetical protein
VERSNETGTVFSHAKNEDGTDCYEKFPEFLCDNHENMQLFNGTEAILLMSRYYRTEFSCV